MLKNNKLDKSFGPVGTSAGMLLFFTGLAVTFFSFLGLILVLIGAFIGFSYTSTFIDFEKKQIKFSNNLFGFIKIGKWIRVEPDMIIRIKKSKKVWRAYSRGNRTLNITDSDYRLILYNSRNKEIIPVKKTDTLDSAKAELHKLSNQLGLSLI